MSRHLYRLKSLYRRNPLYSLALTAGSVDVAIGGVTGHALLLLLGLGAIGIGIAWRRALSRPLKSASAVPVRLLPARASRLQLPPLTLPPEDDVR